MASRIAYFRHGQDPELVYAHTTRWPRTRELREQVATKHDLVQAIRKHVWDLPPSFVVKLLTGEMLDDFQDLEPVPLTAGVVYIETIPRGNFAGVSSVPASGHGPGPATRSEKSYGVESVDHERMQKQGWQHAQHKHSWQPGPDSDAVPHSRMHGGPWPQTSDDHHNGYPGNKMPPHMQQHPAFAAAMQMQAAGFHPSVQRWVPGQAYSSPDHTPHFQQRAGFQQHQHQQQLSAEVLEHMRQATIAQHQKKIQQQQQFKQHPEEGYMGDAAGRSSSHHSQSSHSNAEAPEMMPGDDGSMLSKPPPGINLHLRSTASPIKGQGRAAHAGSAGVSTPDSQGNEPAAVSSLPPRQLQTSGSLPSASQLPVVPTTAANMSAGPLLSLASAPSKRKRSVWRIQAMELPGKLQRPPVAGEDRKQLSAIKGDDFAGWAYCKTDKSGQPAVFCWHCEQAGHRLKMQPKRWDRNVFTTHEARPQHHRSLQMISELLEAAGSAGLRPPVVKEQPYDSSRDVPGLQPHQLHQLQQVLRVHQQQHGPPAPSHDSMHKRTSSMRDGDVHINGNGNGGVSETETEDEPSARPSKHPRHSEHRAGAPEMQNVSRLQLLCSLAASTEQRERQLAEKQAQQQQAQQQ